MCARPNFSHDHSLSRSCDLLKRILFLQPRTEIAAMSSQAERQAKKKAKVKTMMEEADRAQTYILPAREQPGRVPLRKIGFHPRNRGGQDILPMHVHSVALDVCTNGASKRRYNNVFLFVGPEKELGAWRKEPVKMLSKSTFGQVQRHGDGLRHVGESRSGKENRPGWLPLDLGTPLCLLTLLTIIYSLYLLVRNQ